MSMLQAATTARLATVATSSRLRADSGVKRASAQARLRVPERRPRGHGHFVAPFTRAESDETAARIRALMAEQGYGLWAVEVVGEAEFIGFVGLNTPRFETTFTPCVEIGWRLSRAHHGRGYATEAALACLEHGFAVLGLDEILSFTTVRNAASRRVMEKIGMYRDAKNDFDQPSVPECHPIRPHVLYRLGWVDWEARGVADGAEDRSESV